jgi:hypothetical protein
MMTNDKFACSLQFFYRSGIGEIEEFYVYKRGADTEAVYSRVTPG